jgi:SAM-dependent methyltransferase
MSSEIRRQAVAGSQLLIGYSEHLDWEHYMPHYRTDRGIKFASWNPPVTASIHRDIYVRHFDFNPFAYLRVLAAEEQNRPIEVLEGGCGVGQALVDLKTGVFSGYPSVFYPALGSRIRTTGITLNPEHTKKASEVDPKFAVDEMRVGPLGEQQFDVDFDFIYDFLGVAFYYPEEAISTYDRVLTAGGLVYTRFNAMDRALAEESIERSSLEVAAKGGPGQWDVLLQKAGG